MGSAKMTAVASKLDEDKLYPLVRFENGRTLFCTPETFSVVGLHGNWEARRWQLPLILAWAMSVHKSQGQTLSKLKVDLKRTFENGQGPYSQYSALALLPPDSLLRRADILARLRSMGSFNTERNHIHLM